MRHIVSLIKNVWQKYWDGNIIYAHGKSQKASVAILFSNKIVEIVNKYVGSKGHGIILDMLADKVRYTLVNIYAPNTDDVTFLQDIHLRVQSVGNNQIVIGGDFNLVLDSEKDSINRMSNNNNAAYFVNEWLEEESHCDVY